MPKSFFMPTVRPRRGVLDLAPARSVQAAERMRRLGWRCASVEEAARPRVGAGQDGSGAEGLLHFLAHFPGVGAGVHRHVGPAQALALAHRPEHTHAVRQAQGEPAHGE